MDTSVTYTTTSLKGWNLDRRSEHRMEDLATAFLRDPAITDRDRIAFALRELRRFGYEVEARPVDWTQPKMICSIEDSLGSFGNPAPSGLHRRLAAIAERCGIPGSVYAEDRTFSRLAVELYREDAPFDENDYGFLKYEYEFEFKANRPSSRRSSRPSGSQHGLRSRHRTMDPSPTTSSSWRRPRWFSGSR
jgi:hypothetical protein